VVSVIGAFLQERFAHSLILDSRVVDLSMVYIEIILCPNP